MSRSRVMFVGTNSGCGKTTVTCAVMKALADQGLVVSPFKCGPDYIDPMFHKKITGRPCVNLDLFFLKAPMVNWLMDHHMADADISIVEGVMGMYDGIGVTTKASAFDVAVATHTPMILVVNARGMSVSLAAMIMGYINYGGSDLVKGVILNNVGRGMYLFLKDTIESQTGVKVLGYLERQPEAVIESRHLGLVTADEIGDLDKKLKILSEAAEKSIDLQALKCIADSADDGFTYKREAMDFEAELKKESDEKVRLAVALDRAFCFYYESNFDLFSRAGIEVVPFSPLENEPVPEDVDGVYLGGGYPEVYARELAENKKTKESLKQCFQRQMPVIAECGGFMYLHEYIEDKEGIRYPMTGIISGTAKLTEKLGPFGYVDFELKQDGLFGKKGDIIKAHEFHYSVSDNVGEDFVISKNSQKKWCEGHGGPFLYCGYPHLYFYSHVDSVMSLKQAMAAYQKRRQTFKNGINSDGARWS